MSWTITGVTNPTNLRRQISNGGDDHFDFAVPSQNALTDASPIAHGAAVSVTGPGGKIFSGTLITNPRLATHDSELQRLRIAGPMHRLKRCTYLQNWVTYNELLDINLPIPKSHVILNRDSSGNRITISEQIQAIVTFAAGKGIAIANGSYDTTPSLPFDERENITCAEAIHALLRWIPDYILWIDYTPATPTLNLRKTDNLTVVEKAITDGSLYNLTAREDLRVPGVHITYDQTSTINGRARRSVVTDTAGDTTHPEAVFATIPLQGRTSNSISADIITEAIPDFTDLSDPDLKTYLKTIFPSLSEIANDDITIEDASRSSTNQYRIIQGPIPKWVDPSPEIDTQTFILSLNIRNDSDDIVDEITDETYTAQIPVTTKPTGTYSTLVSGSTGESVPTGIAAALYASWNHLHHEGSFQYTLEECDHLCTPGKLLEINGITSHIQSLTEDLDTGTSTVNFGPPRRLEADNLIGLFRALRNRQYAWSKEIKDNPEIGDTSADITGPTPSAPSSSGSAVRARLVLKKTNTTDSLEHTIDLDPSAVEFETSGDAAAKTLIPTELLTLVPNGTGYDLRKIQVLATAPYGETVNLIPDGITEGDLLIGGSGTLLQRLAAGTDGQILRIDTGAPDWQTVIPALSEGDLLVGDSSGSIGTISTGTANQYLKSDGTTPVWQTPEEC
jgi:hypothetical protein